MQHDAKMKRWLAYAAAGILVAGTASLLLLEREPSRVVTITTEPVSTLLPHTHGASDTVLDPAHGVTVASVPVEIPETMWVTEASIQVEHAPFGVIHHLHLYRVSSEGAPSSPENSIFQAGQDARASTRFPAPSGILLRAGERIMLTGMLHNPLPPLGEGGIYKDVTVTATLSGVGEGEGRYVPLSFSQTQVSDTVRDDNADTLFSVPAGASHQTRSSMDNPPGSAERAHTFREDGWIVSMGAHLHAWEGGEQVVVYVNGKRVRTFRSHLADPDIPWSFRTEIEPALIRVKRGDMLTVSATYSNPGETALEGAMGVAGIFYTQNESAQTLESYGRWWAIQGWFYGAYDALRTLVL
jgi:hypothetical protein